MLATREGFGDELCASANKNIIVLTADLTEATRLNKFRQQHPDQFIQVGIAEANMIGIASGISEYNYRVFITSFASFLTGRYDILRMSLSYINAPVVIVGTHSGIAVGRDGPSQMGTEDISLMRSLPNMNILHPSTYIEAKQITRHTMNSNKLTYLRLCRQPVPECLPDWYKFEFNKIQMIKSHDKSSIGIMSTGCMLHIAMEVSSTLCRDKLYSDVFNVSTIKPLDTNTILSAAQKYKMIVSIEDHSTTGGLGSAIAECVCDLYPCRILRIGIEDTFAESGDPTDLYQKYGLSPVMIYNKIKNNYGYK